MTGHLKVSITIINRNAGFPRGQTANYSVRKNVHFSNHKKYLQIVTNLQLLYDCKSHHKL